MKGFVFLKENYSELLSVANSHYLDRLIICYESIKAINKEAAVDVRNKFKDFYLKNRKESYSNIKQKIKWWTFNRNIYLYAILRKVGK